MGQRKHLNISPHVIIINTLKIKVLYFRIRQNNGTEMGLQIKVQIKYKLFSIGNLRSHTQKSLSYSDDGSLCSHINGTVVIQQQSPNADKESPNVSSAFNSNIGTYFLGCFNGQKHIFQYALITRALWAHPSRPSSGDFISSVLSVCSQICIGSEVRQQNWPMKSHSEDPAFTLVCNWCLLD